MWEGVDDSDFIAACRLVLSLFLSLRRSDADRSSIVPALRGLPRFPCVRNHPPTCCSRRQGPETVKPYTESLWALMKDSETAERITNARLLHTHVPADIRTQNRQTLRHATGSRSSGSEGRWELESGWRDEEV